MNAPRRCWSRPQSSCRHQLPWLALPAEADECVICVCWKNRRTRWWSPRECSTVRWRLRASCMSFGMMTCACRHGEAEYADEEGQARRKAVCGGNQPTSKLAQLDWSSCIKAASTKT